MLKNTKFFTSINYRGILAYDASMIAPYAVNTKSTLNIIPGNNAASYVIRSEQFDNRSPEYFNGVALGFSKSPRKHNYLTIGLATNIDFQITSPDDVKKLQALKIDYSRYYFSLIHGDSVHLTVGIYATSMVLDAKYAVNNATISTPSGTIIGMQLSGSVGATLNTDDFKSWLFILSPTQVQEVSGTSGAWLSFADSGMGNVSTRGIVLRSVNPNAEPDSVICEVGFFSKDVIRISFDVQPSPYLWVWQRLLPDTSVKTITAGTPAKSTLHIGALAVSSSSKTNLVFRNVSQGNTSAEITKLVLTNITQFTNQLTNSATLIKSKVLNDFSIEVKLDNTTSIVSQQIPLTGEVTLQLPAPIFVADLGTVSIVVNYAPKVKIIPSVAMLTPYVPATATTMASAINSSRKIRVKLFGFIDGSVDELPVGDPLEVSASVA